MSTAGYHHTAPFIQFRSATEPPAREPLTGGGRLKRFEQAKGTAEQVLGRYRPGVCSRTYDVLQPGTEQETFAICVEWAIAGRAPYTERVALRLDGISPVMSEIGVLAQTLEQHAAQVYFDHAVGRVIPQ